MLRHMLAIERINPTGHDRGPEGSGLWDLLNGRGRENIQRKGWHELAAA